MIDRDLIPKPGEPWTLASATAFCSAHDANIATAMTRLQKQLEADRPLASVYVYRYTPDAMCRYCSPRDGRDGQAVGYVEMRLPSGVTYSGTVSVRWADGTIAVTENPPVPA